MTFLNTSHICNDTLNKEKTIIGFIFSLFLYLTVIFIFNSFYYDKFIAVLITAC